MAKTSPDAGYPLEVDRLQIENADLRKENQELLNALNHSNDNVQRLASHKYKLLTALQTVEWVEKEVLDLRYEGQGWTTIVYCPWCDGDKPKHADNCPRQAAIASVEASDAAPD